MKPKRAWSVLSPAGFGGIRSQLPQPCTSSGQKGQTEGQINRLKNLKCQMYDWAQIDLLNARLLGPI